MGREGEGEAGGDEAVEVGVLFAGGVVDEGREGCVSGQVGRGGGKNGRRWLVGVVFIHGLVFRSIYVGLVDLGLYSGMGRSYM